MQTDERERDTVILDAVTHLLTETGFRQLTTDAVAARARVSKQTIYRRWPSKAKLVVAAVRSLNEGSGELPDTGSLQEDLKQLLKLMREQLLDNDRLSIPAALSAARRTDHELDEALLDLSRERRRPFIAIMERAVERGELPADADIDSLTDGVVGAVFLRYLFRRIEVDDNAIDGIIEAVLGGTLKRLKAKPKRPKAKPSKGK